MIAHLHSSFHFQHRSGHSIMNLIRSHLDLPRPHIFYNFFLRQKKYCINKHAHEDAHTHIQCRQDIIYHLSTVFVYINVLILKSNLAFFLKDDTSNAASYANSCENSKEYSDPNCG